MADSNKRKKLIFAILRTCVVLGVIFWFGREFLSGEDIKNVGEVLLHDMNKGVFASAVMIFLLSQMIISFRWIILLRSQDIHIGYWPALKLYFLGWFYNNFMPSSLGGDFVRAWYVTHHTDKKLEGALSVFMDRLVGFLGTLMITLVSWFIFIGGRAIDFGGTGVSEETVETAEQSSIAMYILFGAAGILFFLVVGLVFSGAFRLAFVRFLIKLRTKLIETFVRGVTALRMYCCRPLSMLGAVGLTIFMQLMVITGFWLIGRNLGITADLRWYFVIFPLTWVVGSIPVSIGGLGLVEGSLVYLFVQLGGVGQDEQSLVTALALCQRLVWIITSFPGAGVHLSGKHLPREIFVDEKSGIN